MAQFQKGDTVTFLVSGVVESVGPAGEVYILSNGNLYCRPSDQVGAVTCMDPSHSAPATEPPIAKGETPLEQALVLFSVIQLLDRHLAAFAQISSKLQRHMMRGELEALERDADEITYKLSEILTTAITAAVFSNVDEQTLLTIYRAVVEKRDTLVAEFRKLVPPGL